MDAIWENTDQEKLAQRYVSIFSQAIKKYKLEHNWKNISVDILLAILVIAGLAGIIYLIGKLFKFFKIK